MGPLTIVNDGAEVWAVETTDLASTLARHGWVVRAEGIFEPDRPHNHPDDRYSDDDDYSAYQSLCDALPDYIDSPVTHLAMKITAGDYLPSDDDDDSRHLNGAQVVAAAISEADSLAWNPAGGGNRCWSGSPGIRAAIADAYPDE